MAELGKFERKLPEDRRRTLIEATLACLAREGHAGLSIRKISKEAGISIGLINHHYSGKDELVGHAYETMALALLENIETMVAAAGDDPRAKLSAYFRASLSAPVMERSTLRTWVVFWGMIEHSPAMKDVHDRTYAGYRRLLSALLKDFFASRGWPEPDVRLAAIGIVAMLDGLWLEWCLNPEIFTPDEAIGLCERWADVFLNASAPRATS